MKKYIFFAMAAVLAYVLFACSGTDSTEEVPSFLYHSVKPTSEIAEASAMVVSRENFEEDLQYLQENGYTAISLTELLEHYENPDYKLPDKPVLITFDDGYRDNYLYAYPLLEKYDAKAVIFTIGWSVGRDRFILSDDPINPHFTWEEAREMVDSGFIEIGSHTYDMHSQEGLSYGHGEPCGYGLGRITDENADDYAKRIIKDLKKSRKQIEENTGQQAISFAYPYGFYNEEVINMVKAAGFKLAFITESDAFKPSPYEIRRFTINSDVRISDILK